MYLKRIQGQEVLLINRCSGCLEVGNVDLNYLFQSFLTCEGNERGGGKGFFVSFAISFA